MQLFLISLLFVIYLPNSSLGINCLGCQDPNNCATNETPTVIDCGDKMCYLEEYKTSNQLRKLGCDSNNRAFEKNPSCWTESTSDDIRRCTCGRNLCNRRLQCRSCYGNRTPETKVTDFVCKENEIPVNTNCPLDKSICMIEWDSNGKSETIGCSSRKIPEGQTFKCSVDYYGKGSHCYCNTNLCNQDSLKEKLEKLPAAAQSDDSDEEDEFDENKKKGVLPFPFPSSKSSVDWDQIVIIKVAVFVAIVGLAILLSILMIMFPGISIWTKN